MADPLADPVLIMVAPNGARRTKADHPALPIEPDELAATAAACRTAGAAALHLHVRDDAGAHSLDAGRYREAIAVVQGAVGDGLVIQITTEAVGRYAPDQQIAVVEALVPEAASVALRELAPDAESEPAAARFYRWAAEAGISIQHILYSDADLERFRALRARGLIPDAPGRDRPLVLCVLGRYARDQQSLPRDLLPFCAAGLDDLDWAMCAFGRREAACALTAAALGGHIRVGFENNLHLPDGTTAPDNAALVRVVAEGVTALGRGLADAGAARALLTGTSVG